MDHLKKELHKISFWSWIRILIVVLLFIGAYSWGVIEGSKFGPKYPNTPGKYGRQMMGDYQRQYQIKTVEHQSMNHDTMNHDAMTMADMVNMVKGKSGDDLNKAFLEGMIPHHEGAVEMAKYLAASNKPELVKLGGEIIVAQTREIEQMKKWMIEWGYTSTGSASSGALTPEEVMMRDHCKQMPEMMGCEKYR